MAKNTSLNVSICRKGYLLLIIDNGYDTLPKMMMQSRMPRRTIQDTLATMHELKVELENDNGVYRVIDWGFLNKASICIHLMEIKHVLKISSELRGRNVQGEG